MQVTISFDGDKLLNELMENYPEASFCLRCVKYDYEACEFSFRDDEEGVTYHLNREKLQKALPKYIQMMLDGKLNGIARYVLPDFQDAGQWDAVAIDGLVQVAVFDDVIYG